MKKFFLFNILVITFIGLSYKAQVLSQKSVTEILRPDGQYVIRNEIATLVNENLSAGTYSYNFDASKLTSGVYFYKLQAGEFIETRKMILTK